MTKTQKPKSKKVTPANARTKAEQVVGLLGRPTGASVAEMLKATGWQAHSVRGFLAGSLKKKGHTVSSNMDGSGVRRYRLTAPVDA